MLSQPSINSLTPSHKIAGTLGNLSISRRQSIQRTSSVSSVLFARRPSTASSLVRVSSQLSPLHQRVWLRVDPSFSTTSATDLDHCFGGGGGCSVRRPRDEQRDAGQDLYDFLKVSDLEEYYTVFSKHLKARKFYLVNFKFMKFFLHLRHYLLLFGEFDNFIFC